MLIQTGAREAILAALTDKIFFLSLAQAATFYGHASDPVGAAEQGLKRLMRGGLLARTTVAVQQIPLVAPLFRWPEQGDPDFRALAYRGQARWRNACLRTVSVWYATDIAAQQFGWQGGAGIFRRPHHLTHEFHMNEIFFDLVRREPGVAASFIPERDLTARYLPDFKAGDRLPDGIIFREGKPEAIEFAGRARAPRLAKLHKFCLRNRPPISYTLY